MSIWRTVYPRDTLAVPLPDGTTVVIDAAGVAVADGYDQAVRDYAAAVHVQLATGAVALPARGRLEQRVTDVETVLRGMPIPLVEQAQRAASGSLVRSGQLVPVRPADNASSPVTVVLEPGATGSRVGVRYDGGPSAAPVTLAGSGGDSVPALTLAAAGATVFLEGIAGGGGWRIVSLYQPGTGTIPWSQVTDRPSIPTRYDQLDGTVPDANIPSGITRDTELADGLAGKSNTGHTHPGYATNTHTHTFPRMLGPYSPSTYNAVASGSSGRTAASVVVPDPGFDWLPLCYAQLEVRCATGSRAGLGVYRQTSAAGNIVAHGSGLDPVNQGPNGNGWWQIPAIPYYGGNALVAAGASTAARTFLLCPITDYGSGNVESSAFLAQLQVWVVPA